MWHLFEDTFVTHADDLRLEQPVAEVLNFSPTTAVKRNDADDLRLEQPVAEVLNFSPTTAVKQAARTREEAHDDHHVDRRCTLPSLSSFAVFDRASWYNPDSLYLHITQLYTNLICIPQHNNQPHHTLLRQHLTFMGDRGSPPTSVPSRG
eukprot:CAMPEP_0119476580 /NCGR_PEP_ID=MMETSP1344-20130328/7040_1 /TAXON_ID=236787 /ORGANISM="Florenciella parvula, Strain CCMP2471" /LENGTH=149 /DNA_ID=CAMNT_0007510365 /DNA_START=450 /DNA_END=898 /DNA_ORIENTATION=-